MKAIVTVLGRDRVGIIASVCALLSEYNINILDISQTILEQRSEEHTSELQSR